MSSTKRIRILCGICKATKHYNLARGIKKIANILACENCRHFYLKLKDNPFPLDCISPIKGSCYSKCSFMQTRCKCCWAMQILDTCPHPKNFYNSLSNWISEDCKKQIRGLPVNLDDIDIDLRGKATIENNENDEWTESPTSEKEIKELLSESNDDVSNAEEGENSKTDSQNEISTKKKAQKNEKKTDQVVLSMSDLALDIEDDVYIEEDESLVDDPASMDVDNSMDSSISSRRSSKGSERLKRKRKQVEYFTKQATSGRKTKGPIYGPDGKISKTKMDLCDCLQPECVGCHFPCPKCRSPKCGNECRVNRRWYYERVEVEGTKMFWINRFVPKI